MSRIPVAQLVSICGRCSKQLSVTVGGKRQTFQSHTGVFNYVNSQYAFKPWDKLHVYFRNASELAKFTEGLQKNAHKSIFDWPGDIKPMIPK